MRDILFLFCGLILMLNLSAQRIMKLDTTLKANSEAMPVKTKGGIVIGDIMKYQFGSFNVISAKTGWGSSTSKSKLFSKIEKSESKQKSSFVVVGNERDTVTVNISININSESVSENYLSIRRDRISIEQEEYPSEIESTKNIVAIVSLTADTAAWNLIYISRVNSDSSMNTKKYGVLTDSKTTIEIGEVTSWEDGKSRNLYLTKGFEFYKDGKAIAAVQTPLNTFQKKFVWMKNDLDYKIKNVLAAAVVVMMSYNFL